MYYYSWYYFSSWHFPSFPHLQLHTDYFYLDSLTYWNTSKKSFFLSVLLIPSGSLVSLEVPPTSELLKFKTLNFHQRTPFSLHSLLFSSLSFPNHCTYLAQSFLTSHYVSSLFTGLFDSLATHPAQVTRWPFLNFNSINVTPLAKTCTGFFLIAHSINLALGAL